MLIAALDRFCKTATVGEVGRFVESDDGSAHASSVRSERQGTLGYVSRPGDWQPRRRRAIRTNAAGTYGFVAGESAVRVCVRKADAAAGERAEIGRSADVRGAPPPRLASRPAG